jgi:hypothetical protein
MALLPPLLSRRLRSRFPWVAVSTCSAARTSPADHLPLLVAGPQAQDQVTNRLGWDHPVAEILGVLAIDVYTADVEVHRIPSSKPNSR